ncbi:hypothetical protein [Blastococcus haudaquaticus]|uniref:SipW-cognate class signal peptide n=1 Tax=Blastococcus haudaquaticus TaxID=1938745 RepID=A0A286H8D7_9ACTN|nr:hypothetical protein [Blastococcus haudaquaticus]SOE04037.1 hypothetical protein SAMN06272739_4428 [Blastococcus haudaquaticus]
MSIRSDVTAARRSSLTKVVASAGVVAAAAAVAGLGTFGSFTDSTTPVVPTVDTGTVSINLSPASSYATVPVTTGGFLPGDSSATPFDVTNDGSVAWESLTFTSWATTSSVLDSDPLHGLQLALESCSESWTVSGSGYACGGDLTPLYAGPIMVDRALAGAVSVAPGRTDHVLATISFPETAGDEHQGKVSQMAFRFTAVQRDGATS